MDNSWPGSWLWLFSFTTAFAVVYLCHLAVFHLGQRPIPAFDQLWRQNESIRSHTDNHFEALISTLTPSKDPVVLAHGSAIFQKLCFQCHRKDGGGDFGPNLCDDYWIHGSNYVDTVSVIYHGVPPKGMVTWKDTLHPVEIEAVASYIYTLRGTHPPNPKPPENQVKLIKPNIYE